MSSPKQSHNRIPVPMTPHCTQSSILFPFTGVTGVQAAHLTLVSEFLTSEFPRIRHSPGIQKDSSEGRLKGVWDILPGVALGYRKTVMKVV